MDLYKLNDEEINKLADEFNKTGFGRKAKFFAMMPMWIFVFSLFMECEQIIEYDFIKKVETSVPHFWFMVAGISALAFAVTILQYGRMLSEYAKSKK